MLSFTCLEDLQVQRYIRYFDNVEFELICEFKIEGNNLKAVSKSVLNFWKDTILLGENCLQRDKSGANWQLEMPNRIESGQKNIAGKHMGTCCIHTACAFAEGTIDRRGHHKSQEKCGAVFHMITEIFSLIYTPHHKTLKKKLLFSVIQMILDHGQHWKLYFTIYLQQTIYYGCNIQKF